MENLTYDETPGKEEIADGVKYIYTDVYGLEGTDTFKVYLPGAPVRDLSEEEYFWVRTANENGAEGAQDTLTIPVIVNEKMEYGIYSYKRMTPYEEAKSTLATYQASYDAAEEELKKATIQSRMDDCSIRMYDISDSCLNDDLESCKIQYKVRKSSMRFSLSRENGLQTKKQQATKSWIKTMDLRHRWTAVLRWQSLPWSVVKNWQII